MNNREKNQDIKVILYDADGVVVNAYMLFSKLLDQKYGISLETTQGFFKGPFVDCLNGTKDMREILPSYLKEWGWEGTLDDFLDFWFSSEHSIEKSIIDHIDILRKNGIKCYVATNQEKHRAKYILEDMGFNDHFDGLFASSHLGVRKPNIEFFKKVLVKVDAKPEEVLFWDDTKENIDAARSLGLHAEHFTSVEKYMELMKQYGIDYATGNRS